MTLICLALLGSIQTSSVFVADLDLSNVRQGWGSAARDRSVTDTPLSIKGRVFEKGFGTHAASTFKIRLDGRASRFHAFCGVDDNAKSSKASVVFRVLGDGKELWKSPRLSWMQAAVEASVPLRGVQTLNLVVDDAGDGIDFDHGDWGDASLTYTGKPPVALVPPVEKPVILTPPPPASPRINGPSVTGARPRHPFLYLVPATGVRPMRFAAEGLPDSLTLDPATGRITGAIAKRGTYPVRIRATNRKGVATRTLKIVCGDEIALTPQMGWNSWYVWLGGVSDAIVRDAADAMVANGMAQHGWQFVCIDDCWARVPGSTDAVVGGPTRDAEGRIRPNAKFPDMKALTAYIHGKGLKAGIYTSPGPTTCAGFEGAFGHEALDAKTFADWGFDLLKYDWCSYKAEVPGVEGFKKPYRIMGSLLKAQSRDIVLNLCQYGMADVWKWGKEVGGHSWRTADDLGHRFGLFQDGFELYARENLHRYAGPGAFNDPDYLLLGELAGSGGKKQDPLHAQRAVHPSVDVVPPLRPPDPQRGHHDARPVHAQPPHERRGDRGGSGRARESRPSSCQGRRDRGVGQAVGGRQLGRRAVQPRRRVRPRSSDLEGVGAHRVEARAGPVATEGSGHVHRRLLGQGGEARSGVGEGEACGRARMISE